MGFGSIWHWLIVLAIVVIIFGTKKLRNIGSDMGGAIRNFKDAMNEGQQGKPAENQTTTAATPASQTTIDVKPVPPTEVGNQKEQVSLNKETAK